MKNLYLMRHTEPKPGHPDNADRPLTEAGLQQADDMAAWLAGHIGRVDIVIHSPFVRATQTAQAMRKALGAHLADTRLLVPGADIMANTWADIERLAGQSKDVLVVGHDPNLNRLLCWLLCVDPLDANSTDVVRFDWGAIAALQVSRSGKEKHESAKLMWLVTPLIVLADKEIVEAARGVVESISRV